MKLVCDCGNEEELASNVVLDILLSEEENLKKRKSLSCKNMDNFKIGIPSFRYIHIDCKQCGRKIKLWNKF